MALLNPWMKFVIFFWLKSFFWSIMKMAIRKKLQHVPGSAKSRICAGKSTKREFSKKGLARENWIPFCLGFLWISWRPGMLNWKRVFFGHLKSCTCSVDKADLIKWKLFLKKIVKIPAVEFFLQGFELVRHFFHLIGGIIVISDTITQPLQILTLKRRF